MAHLKVCPFKNFRVFMAQVKVRPFKNGLALFARLAALRDEYGSNFNG